MNSAELHVVERFAFDPAALTITRTYTAQDPLYFTGEYTGSDTIGVADLPYAPDKCQELTFVDFSNDGTAPGGVASTPLPGAAGAPASAAAALPRSPPRLRRPRRPHRPQPRQSRGGNSGNGGTDERLVSCSGPDSLP